MAADNNVVGLNISNSYDSKKLLVGGDGNDTLYNKYASHSTLQGGAGNDSIYNRSSNYSVLLGDAGNDSIYNDWSNNVSIGGGADNDSVYNNWSDNVLIDGGAGNDSIYNSWGKNVTIIGDADDDFVSLNYADNNLIIYKSGDGNDTIQGLNDTATLKISGEQYWTQQSGADVIINVDAGKITLIDGLNKSYYLDITAKNLQSIAGTDQADTINNTLISSTIDGFGGNDFITNSGANVYINGGGDDDTINNSGDKATLHGNYGNDSISNSGANVYIDGDENDDFITNSGDKVTIEGDYGKDRISNSGANVYIYGGYDNDSITNEATNVKIYGGANNDSITNSGANVYISGDVNDDFITNSGDKATIEGGTDDDTIINSGGYASISGGVGNNTITNSGAYVTINGKSGNDSISNTGKYVSILSANNDKIINYGDNVTIESVYISNDYQTSITNSGINVSIKGDDGNNIVVNTSAGSNAIIETGKGNDTITNSGASAYINGEDDDDVIINTSTGSNAIILAGTGNDIITNSGAKVSINGGDGNDTITNSGANVLIQYDGGNDIIEGFNATSTLSISNGTATYSSQTSGQDVLVTVGDNKIVLSNAASLSAVNISGTEKIAETWLITDKDNPNVVIGTASKNVDASDRTTDIKITANSLDNSILGGKGNDTLNAGTGNNTLTGGEGANVFVYGGGKDVITDYKAGDAIQITGAPMANVSGDDLVFDVGNTNAAITVKDVLKDGAAQVKILGVSEYTYHKDGTISDNKNASLMTNYSGTFNASDYNKVDASAVKQGLTILGGKTTAATINGTALADSIENFISNSSIMGGAGNDTITNKTSYMEDVTRQVSETKKVEEPVYEKQAYTETEDVYDWIQEPYTYYTSVPIRRRSAGGTYIWSSISTTETRYRRAYKKVGTKTVTKYKDVQVGTQWVDKVVTTDVTEQVERQTNNVGATINGGLGDDYISNEAANFVYYYAAGYGNDTIAGFNEASKISITGGTYSASASGNDIVLKVNDGSITIKDAKGKSINVNGENLFKVAWTLNDTTATYGTPLETLITVNGVKSLNGLALNDKVVTVSAKALGTDKVTISDGYTLALANDVTKTTTTESGWTLNNSTATYKNAVTNAGYVCDGKNISYVNASGGETLITVNGVKSLDGLALNGKVVTVSAKALGTDKVTISDGYTLALANDVTKTSTTATGWTLNNSTATYKNATTNAGYVCDGKNISYVNASGGETLITVNGVKSLDGLALNGKVVTVSAKALGTDKVTISDGYTLALANDVTKTSTTAACWTLNGTTATYKNAATNAGYVCDGKNISYVNASGGETLVTVNGVKSTNGLALNGKVVTVSKAALNAKNVTVSDGYTLALGDNVTKPKNTKAWKLNKTTATYKQTTAAGYTLKDNAINYSKKSTATLATVKGLKSGLKVSDGKISGVSISGTKITLSKAALGTSKVTVSDGYTLALGKNVTKSTTSEKWSLNKNTATLKRTKTAGYNLADNAVSYSKKSTKTLATVTGVNSTKGISTKNNVVTLKASSLNKKVTVNGSGYEFNFASGDYKKASITGSKKADVITSRGKNISISGGAGDDTIKLLGSATTVKGGAGNDIISCNGKGNYSLWGGADNDTLYSSSGADKFIYGKGDGKDVIFGFDDKDTLTLDNLDFTTSYSKKNGTITLKVDGGGSVTLKEFTATTFHINDDTYKISGSKFKKQ
ncbi:MAG: hypothetical protein IJK81_07470 [Selenomonadaceae bacterium]|nr:hypothetical protein [Selenomonadaceae bacterium]